MKRVFLISIIAVLLSVPPVFAMQQVIIETNKGNITIALDNEKAPLTVANFLTYVDNGHYKDTIFHRVIKDFMIQGGNFTVDMIPKKTGEPIKNEAANGLRNQRGTIAMARTSVVDSATSQFFINLKDNDFLDHKNNSDRGFGYAVFGKVVEGMDVVDKIGNGSTHVYRRFPDVPVDPVIILDVRRVTQ